MEIPVTISDTKHHRLHLTLFFEEQARRKLRSRGSEDGTRSDDNNEGKLVNISPLSLLSDR